MFILLNAYIIGTQSYCHKIFLGKCKIMETEDSHNYILNFFLQMHLFYKSRFILKEYNLPITVELALVYHFALYHNPLLVAWRKIIFLVHFYPLNDTSLLLYHIKNIKKKKTWKLNFVELTKLANHYNLGRNHLFQKCIALGIFCMFTQIVDLSFRKWSIYAKTSC